MLEKLKPNEDKVFKTETGECLTIPELGVPKPISDKINELVDAVNKQQIQLNNHECRLLDLQNRVTALDDPSYHEDENSDWYDDPKYREQSADPYAEQRKWIGYLCWFWDDVYGLKTAGVLEDITTIEEEFHYAKKDTCTVWKHCEPVKPDDSIIYKGE